MWDFVQKVIDISFKNLDTFFTDEEFDVLEGVMGLFDGLEGVREEGSSYHLAEVKGIGCSIIPLSAFFLAYDRLKLIKGVFLTECRDSITKL